MAVFFLFLRNVHSSIEILKLKILEHSDPPSQHFFVHKAFSRPFLRRGRLCCVIWQNGTILRMVFLILLVQVIVGFVSFLIRIVGEVFLIQRVTFLEKFG